MHLVICLSALDKSETISSLAPLTAINGAFVELLNVVDPEDDRELERALPPRLMRPRVGDARRETGLARRAIVEELFADATRTLSGLGAARVAGIWLEGRPERAIVAHLEQSRADVCAICRRAEWMEYHDSGPKSVGHVARFVVDHAPCPVLVLR